MIAKLGTVASLVSRCAVLPAVGRDGGRNTFSPQTNSSRVGLKSYRDPFFEDVLRLLGPILVNTRERFEPSQNELHTGVKLTVVQFKPAK